MPQDADIIVIGGGMAGYSAALYAAYLGHRTIVIERAAPGGLIVNTEHIENYPGVIGPVSGMELVLNLAGQATDLGVQTEMGDVERCDLAGPTKTVQTGDDRYTARAVIIASGGKTRRLGLPREDIFEGRGISYCADCDGPLFAGQRVAVAGGGDTAVEAAILLAQSCELVSVVHRGEAFRAASVLRERLSGATNVEILWRSEVTGLAGTDGLERITARNGGGQERALDVTGLFVCIGADPAGGWLGGQVPLDSEGHVIVDLDMATAVPGVYAAGEIRQRSARQLATVAGDGVTAACSASRYLATRAPVRDV